jgi:hypothetical protein
MPQWAGRTSGQAILYAHIFLARAHADEPVADLLESELGSAVAF